MTLYYDFRPQGAYPNLITPEQIKAAEAALQMWETASAGKLRFLHNTLALAADIINIGTGDLAALGGSSAVRGVLALGSALFNDGGSRTITNGVAWMDVAETWDTTFGNGDPSGTFDFFSVAAHEVGHVSGLGHTSDIPTRDIMDSVYSGEYTAASSTDSLLVRMLYDADATTGGSVGGEVTEPQLSGVHRVTLAPGQIVEANFGNQQSIPVVLEHDINNGADMRSGILTIAITFDKPVTITDATALSLQNTTLPGLTLDLSGVVLEGNGTTVVTWDLSGTSLADGTSSAADGVYVASLAGADVVSVSSGAAMPGTYVFEFHRLLADANGDRRVSNADAFVVLNHLRDADGDPFAVGDINGDGRHSNADFFTWANHQGNELPQTPMPLSAIEALFSIGREKQWKADEDRDEDGTYDDDSALDADMLRDVQLANGGTAKQRAFVA